ncbi:hypothetical protein J5N97_004263 [Dioscorea zingiberensis]|uniref:Uncharacterized protein n=1 Tax=Dioscorea zingiberensis TaxID=325984 RepID=A0A9D5HRY4_9LILI|nr:hypothetical protein J5N97_004263 [Dioscorea zingiberensis]
MSPLFLKTPNPPLINRLKVFVEINMSYNLPQETNSVFDLLSFSMVVIFANSAAMVVDSAEPAKVKDNFGEL